jgi:HSP20 family protein
MSTLTTNNNNSRTYTVGNVSWEPTAAQVFRQLPALFNDRWLDGLFDNMDKAFDVPNSHYPYNVKYYANNDGEVYKYEIETALAGIGKDNIKVKVKDGYLTIDVEAEKVEEKEHIKYVRKGISKRKATMSFHLAENVDVKNISSDYRDGLLKVSVPVKQPEIYNVDIKVG